MLITAGWAKIKEQPAAGAPIRNFENNLISRLKPPLNYNLQLLRKSYIQIQPPIELVEIFSFSTMSSKDRDEKLPLLDCCISLQSKTKSQDGKTKNVILGGNNGVFPLLFGHQKSKLELV